MRCSAGKSPASLNIISTLPAGVVLIQRRVSQSARVISDKSFVMARIVDPSTRGEHWTFVQYAGSESPCREAGMMARMPAAAVVFVVDDDASIRKRLSRLISEAG